MPLPLQRIQVFVKPTRNRLLRHRQLKRRVALISREFRRRGVEGASGPQTHYARYNERFDLRGREGGRGAHFYVEEVRDARRGDAVEAWERGYVVRGVGADVGEGGEWWDGGVADEGGVVGAVEELGEEGGFVGGEVEAEEVAEFGGDGDEEFFGEDEFSAGGCLDEDLDAIGAAAVRGDDMASQQDVWSEFRERFFVDLAVVLADGGQETGVQLLQDTEAEVLEYVQCTLLEQISESLGKREYKPHRGLEVILLDEVAKRKQQIRRHRIWEIKAGFHIRILRQLSPISRQSGRRISRHVSSYHFSRREIHILVHLTGSGERGRREWDMESGEVILDNLEIVKDNDAVVDGFVGAGVGIGVCVSP